MQKRSITVIVILGSMLLLAAGVLISDMRVKLGEKTTLPCVLQDQTDDDNVVSWYHEDKLLTIGSSVISDRNRLRVNKPATNEWTLVIIHTDRSSAGTYTCRLARDEGQYRILMTINLFIETRPTVDELRSTPRSVTVTEGTTCNITCIATGLPEPTVTWFRVYTDPEEIHIPTGVSGPQLIIPTIGRYAAGMYACVAENVHGTDQWDITITVQFPLRVTVNQSVFHASVSQQVMMMCSVEGEPINKVYWKDNENRTVDRSNWQYQVTKDELAGYPVTFITLKLHRAPQQQNFGVYTCHAEGPDTEATATIRLEP